MTSAGNKFELDYGGTRYTFDSAQFTFGEHIEETPLLNGDIYRVRAASGKNDLRLRGRLTTDQMSDYLTLITAFASGTIDFDLNGEPFTGWALLSAKLISEENAPYLVCDIILAEVDV